MSIYDDCGPQSQGHLSDEEWVTWITQEQFMFKKHLRVRLIFYSAVNLEQNRHVWVTAQYMSPLTCRAVLEILLPILPINKLSNVTTINIWRWYPLLISGVRSCGGCHHIITPGSGCPRLDSVYWCSCSSQIRICIKCCRASNASKINLWVFAS